MCWFMTAIPNKPKCFDEFGLNWQVLTGALRFPCREFFDSSFLPPRADDKRRGLVRGVAEVRQLPGFGDGFQHGVGIDS